MDFDEPEFKKAFWNWFDNELNHHQRMHFQNFPADMAELFFYNKYWSKRIRSSTE